MRIPIRMIGLATTFFWIFLIAFFVSAVYSVKDVHLDFGDPRMSLSGDNEMVVSLPITIENKGFYNIGSFNLSTEISDAEGSIITRSFTFIPIIRMGENATSTHVMTIDVNNLLQSDQNYLLNDMNLKIYETVSMRVAEVIPVKASTNLSVPWGAPFHDFILGQPEYTGFNITHLRVNVPISFENHAFFDLAGTMQVRLYNNADLLVGEDQTTIGVLQHSSYNGRVEFYIKTDEMTDGGHFEVYLQTSLFNYGPLVIPYG